MGDAWAEGFDATVTLTTPGRCDGRRAAASASRAAAGRSASPSTPSQPLAPGDYVLRVGARAGPASIPSRETARLTIPAAPDGDRRAVRPSRRRRPANKEVPTADLRFRRNEQVRVEIPTASNDPVTARLLDRTGKPLAVPVTAAVRDDATDRAGTPAQLALAPLAPADYVIEIASWRAADDRVPRVRIF